MDKKSSFTNEELLECGHGKMFGIGNARLPLPPMLMFDRITKITDQGGLFDKGEIIAEFDIDPSLWFFDCHFEMDPVMPGCLGLDAMWQLVGFYLGWIGEPGRGRALGSGNVKFAGEILQDAKLVTYHINMKKVIKRGVVLGVGDGTVTVDGKKIYTAEGLKVGLIK
ncbi:MAG: bifunctional 3-hydroxydecanoyl-ACP dehydratase/trans-2-decenoyl-ACP isomerase [Pelagibacterales bacterium]|nr:bifunctional 3-hydroxydecanoyl-ACP dehydratase/trans-2-decenoyl-ACP isomerase [Pelagibacterales bacterium]